jgi:hypothetical protein
MRRGTRSALRPILPFLTDPSVVEIMLNIRYSKIRNVDPARYLHQAALADARGEVLLPADTVD